MFFQSELFCLRLLDEREESIWFFWTASHIDSWTNETQLVCTTVSEHDLAAGGCVCALQHCSRGTGEFVGCAAADLLAADAGVVAAVGWLLLVQR